MVQIKLPNGIFDYDPNQPLGKRGGFGQVYAGKTASGEDVAIKKLHVSATDAAHRELRIADELKRHSYQHVIPFIDSGEDADSGHYFVVMPKAEKSLQNTVDKDGELNAPDAALVLLQILKGLQEVGNLVHRDLKPDNVLFQEDKWKVADFGIARFVEETTSSNTLKDCLSPLYAAPEQWKFERATHETDIYALGCISFFLLTGNPPFITNPSEEHQQAAVPQFVCYDSRLSSLIRMMLRKIPQTRPTTSRIQAILEEVIANPPQKGNTDPLTNLADAAAVVAEKEQQAQAKQQAAASARRAREGLSISAYDMLAENFERLWVKIEQQAPNVERRSQGGTGELNCHLGNSSLYVDFSRVNCIDSNRFKNSHWDVVSMAKIAVRQKSPRYEWSASLWYAKLAEGWPYRWYEVSYWAWEASEFQPFACIDLGDADLAAAKIMHSVDIAFGPELIDDEKEEEFHNRWILLFASAAKGQLRQPSQFPITQWPPQI